MSNITEKDLDTRIASFQRKADDLIDSVNIYERLGFNPSTAGFLADFMDSDKWLLPKYLNISQETKSQMIENSEVRYKVIQVDIFEIIRRILEGNNLLDKDEFNKVSENYLTLTGHDHNLAMFYIPMGNKENVDVQHIYRHAKNRLTLAHGFGAEPSIFEDNLVGHLLHWFTFKNKNPEGIIMSIGALGSPGSTIPISYTPNDPADIDTAINADKHSIILYLQNRLYGFSARANKNLSNLPAYIDADDSHEIRPVVLGHSLGGAATLALKIYFDRAYTNSFGAKILKSIGINSAFKVFGMPDPNNWYNSWQEKIIKYVAPWGFNLLDSLKLYKLKKLAIEKILKSFDPTAPDSVMEKHTNVILTNNDRIDQFNEIMGGAKDHYFKFEQFDNLDQNNTIIVMGKRDKMVSPYKLTSILEKAKGKIQYYLFKESDGHYLKNSFNLAKIAYMI